MARRGLDYHAYSSHRPWNWQFPPVFKLIIQLLTTHNYLLPGQQRAGGGLHGAQGPGLPGGLHLEPPAVEEGGHCGTVGWKGAGGGAWGLECCDLHLSGVCVGRGDSGGWVMTCQRIRVCCR